MYQTLFKGRQLLGYDSHHPSEKLQIRKRFYVDVNPFRYVLLIQQMTGRRCLFTNRIKKPNNGRGK